MPLQSTGRCGTPGALNVMDVLPRILPAVRPTLLRRISNGIPQQDRAVPSSAVCREVVHWGRDIAVRRAVQACARTWPDVAHVYAASRVCLALCAVRRGDLAGALAQVPWAALAPPTVLAWARDVLQGSLPGWLVHALDNDPALMLLAAVALLHELHATDDLAQLPVSPPCAAAMVRGLRVAYDGLRAVLSATGTPATVRLLEYVPVRPQGIGNITHLIDTASVGTALQVSGPGRHADAALSAMGIGAPVSGAGAWLLAGASAAPRRGGGASHPHPKETVAQPGSGSTGAGAAGRSTLMRRPMTGGSARGSGRRRDDGSTDVVRSNPAAAMAGYADTPKELLMSPVYPSADGQTGADPASSRIDPAVPPSAGATPGRAGGVGSRQQHGRRTEVGTALRPGMVSPAAKELPIPAGALDCLQVDDERVARLLVRRQRYRAQLIRFCIPSSDTPWFKSLFAGSTVTTRGMGRWMVSELVHDHVPHSLRPFSVRSYGGEDEVVFDAPSPWRWLGDERIFTLLTVSLLDDQLRPEASGWDPHYMPRNTFRVMQHTGADGEDRLYLAYFLHREREGMRGVNAGFREVEVSAAGHFSVTDTVHGSAIVGDTLHALVASIEKLTGLRCTDSEEHVVAGDTAPRARNLFIDIEQTRSRHAPDTHLPLNQELDMFAPVLVPVAGYPRPFPMFLGSYLQLQDRVLLVDAKGHAAALHYASDASASGSRALRCDTLGACRLAALHGLQSGWRYSVDEVARVLQDNGLLPVPPEMLMELPVTGMMHVPGDEAAVPAARADHVALPTSTFLFDAGRLYYTDHDGRDGLLQLRRAPGEVGTGAAWVDEGNEPRFAARIRLQAGRAYTEADIRRLMERDGFMQGA